jgi:hypothetical protein
MIVYRHIRLDTNEPFYIGIGITEKRAYNRINRSNYWKRIVSKTEYRVDILFDDLSKEEACEKEKEFILLYGRVDLGTGTLVNLTSGGQYTKHSDETKMKISERHKGRIHTDEAKKNMLEGQRKRTDIRKPCSDETRSKMRIASTGRKHTEESISKMRIASTGKKPSEETLKKRSISLMGKRKGKKHSDESKKKMSESANNRIYKKITGIIKYILKNGTEKFKVRYSYKQITYYVGSFDEYDQALKALYDHKSFNPIFQNIL